MQLPSTLLENAVNEFAKLPGIGKKTALRMVLHLLRQNVDTVTAFSETIARMRKEIRFCQRCHNISDADVCSICSNSLRNHHLICIVEKHSRCNSHRKHTTVQWHLSCARRYHFSARWHRPRAAQYPHPYSSHRTRANRRITFRPQSKHTGRHHHLLYSEKNTAPALPHHHHRARHSLRRRTRIRR